MAASPAERRARGNTPRSAAIPMNVTRAVVAARRMMLMTCQPPGAVTRSHRIAAVATAAATGTAWAPARPNHAMPAPPTTGVTRLTAQRGPMRVKSDTISARKEARALSKKPPAGVWQQGSSTLSTAVLRCVLLRRPRTRFDFRPPGARQLAPQPPPNYLVASSRAEASCVAGTMTANIVAPSPSAIGGDAELTRVVAAGLHAVAALGH